MWNMVFTLYYSTVVLLVNFLIIDHVITSFFKVSYKGAVACEIIINHLLTSQYEV